MPSQRPPRRPRAAPDATHADDARSRNVEIAGVELPNPTQRGAVLGMLLRFVSCGILSLISGLTWRFTLAPARVGVGTALLGIMFLLLGFVLGGILWYIRDARLRQRAPQRIADERLIFSFVVFALVPFAVGVLVTLVWLLALLIGAAT
ncbi:MAG: hypothetical protein ACR2GX_02650 [Candidatus Dormibacteria bacterium]